MKFAMNGALTIGTLDGANVEIRDAVGAETLLPVRAHRSRRCAADESRTGYDPAVDLRAATRCLRRIHRPDRVRPLLASATAGLFRPLVDALLTRDEYLLLADYDAYVECQDRVDVRVRRSTTPGRAMSILTVARMGRFSSDRAIREYCRDIWHVAPLSR